MTLERVRPSPVWQCYSASCRQLRAAWLIRGGGEAIGESGTGQKRATTAQQDDTTLSEFITSLTEAEAHRDRVAVVPSATVYNTAPLPSPRNCTADPTTHCTAPPLHHSPPLHHRPGWRQANFAGPAYMLRAQSPISPGLAMDYPTAAHRLLLPTSSHLATRDESTETIACIDRNLCGPVTCKCCRLGT